MNGKRLKLWYFAAISPLLGLVFLTSCNNPPASDQHLQEQAAQATEQAKQQSKVALEDARIAAKNAEQTVNDVAAGVKQGLHSKDAPAGGRIDLNDASRRVDAFVAVLILRLRLKFKSEGQHHPAPCLERIQRAGFADDRVVT